MSLIKYRASRSFINSATLHSYKTVFNYVKNSYSVLSAYLIKLQNYVLGTHFFTVQCRGNSFFEIKLNICRLVGSVDRRNPHFKEPFFLVLRLVSRILKIKPFVRKVPKVFILWVVCFATYLKRNIMCLRIIYLFVTRFYRPFAPRSDYWHIRCKMLYGKLKTNLIVSLSRATVADCIGILL